MSGRPLTTTLPAPDYSYITGLAKALGRSVSSVLAEIVRKHLEDEERRLKTDRRTRSTRSTK